MAKKYLSDDNLLYVWQKIKLLLAGKADLSSLSNYALKSDITSLYRMKGSIVWNELIALENAQVGDTYNVTDRGGANYVCIKANTAGENAWDKLGETVDLSKYALKESLESYVDKYNNQTIEGVKTFKDGIKLGNNQYGATTDQIEIDGGVLNAPNLDDMTYRGIYHCIGGTNTPSFDYTNTSYDLMVFKGSEYDSDGYGGDTITQIVISGWKWWIRRNNGDDWGAWERFGQTTTISSLTNTEIDTIFES